MNVELIYDQSCPNVEATRVALLRAFAKLGRPPRWTEWERSAPDSPAYARTHGSPTILVDGQDIARDKPSGESCRVYLGAMGTLGGVPPLDKIVDALIRTPGGPGSSGLFAAVPTTGALLLPIGTCPACWPAYVAFLGPLGLVAVPPAPERPLRHAQDPRRLDLAQITPITASVNILELHQSQSL